MRSKLQIILQQVQELLILMLAVFLALL